MLAAAQTAQSHQVSQQGFLGNPRDQSVNAFLRLKQEFKELPRELIFLGLAINDKYLAYNSGHQQIDYQDGLLAIHRKVVACIFIAWKFQGKNRPMTLRKVLKLGQSVALTMQELIDQEWQIMEGINYEIPIDNTYDAMVRDFSQQDEHISQNIQLAARCLAFYNQAIRLSTDFVLDSNLGPQIIQCMTENHVTDARIAWAYSLIAKKNQINKNCLLQ